ncbi:16S rRNA (guanine(966)-N(2))-methyltransferase RsmD [Candidatus Nitrospira bockiana]
MRVISGAQKGRRLLISKSRRLRPTSGRVKEALFSILGDRIPGSTFLDLYAGTGAVGIEALSRGARRAAFVESDAQSVRLLHANVERCGLSAQSDIRPSSVDAFLAHGGGRDVFDIVFADPPYGDERAAALLPSLSRSAIIGPHTIVILEHPAKQQPPAHVGRLVRTRQYRYGDTMLSLFQATDQERS